MRSRIHLILLSCFIVVLPSMAEPTYSQSLTSITESDIHAMLNAVDKAARNRNVAGMIAPLAPESKIKLTILDPKSDREAVVTLTKDQYASNARQLMRSRISYQFERKNTRIKIYDATTATVTCEYYETIKMRQKIVRGASSEVLYVTLRNGKLVITSVETRSRFY